MTFLRNAWYVATWSRDLGRSPMRRTILGENVVLFRKQNGGPVALADRCPHKLLPLSRGRLKGDLLQCGYHGLTYDETGACVHVPGQDVIPRNARVASYPVAENMGLVWIWMGDPARADRGEIYDLPEYHDPAWGVAHGDALHQRSDYLLLCDNLCDPSHVSYVHPTTLGNPDGEGVPVTWEQHDWGVTTSRWTIDSEPIGLVKAFGRFEGRVDRWQFYHMHVPSIAIIDFGSAATGTGAPDGNRENCLQIYACHFLTPETATTCIDRWLHVRNFAPGDVSIGERISDMFRLAFAEDKEILEAIQTEEDACAGGPRVGLDIDAPPGLFRRMIDQRIRAEAHAAAAE